MNRVHACTHVHTYAYAHTRADAYTRTHVCEHMIIQPHIQAKERVGTIPPNIRARTGMLYCNHGSIIVKERFVTYITVITPDFRIFP